MTKWLWLLVVGGLAAALVGCGGANGVTSPDEVQRISPREAKALLDSGEATLYDTRSADAYRSQHAAGAISLPEEDLASRFDELPDDGRALIFYCT